MDSQALAEQAGITWFDYQEEALAEWAQQGAAPRACLYYKTGAGKTITALALMAQRGVHEVLVLAPPLTHAAWKETAQRWGIQVETISHAKFRQKTFRTSRTRAVIVDEFHLLGGHNGKGWKKMQTLARVLQAPLVIASATPSYNDAERVYCVQAVIDPHAVKGGFLQFLYQHCQTEQNPFGLTPKVTGFLRYKNAEEFLASLPRVMHVPDDTAITIEEKVLSYTEPDEMQEYGLDRARGRIIASQMEHRHRLKYLQRVEENYQSAASPHIRDEVFRAVVELYQQEGQQPLLVFSASSELAAILAQDLNQEGIKTGLVVGKQPRKEKVAIVEDFKNRKVNILVGTATLATGVDGLDKMCHTMLIFDDTDDASLRRQLLGRILPRGETSAVQQKRFVRLTFI